MIPQNLFDRLFGVKNESWSERKKERSDLVLSDVNEVAPAPGPSDRLRLDEHLTSVPTSSRHFQPCLPTTQDLKEPETSPI